MGLRVLLVASGEPAEPGTLREAAAAAGYVVAVNGGFRQAQEAGLRVDLLLGDLDSLGGVPIPKGVRVLAFPSHKDATDLELALDHVSALRPDVVEIFGGLGGRLDHLLANLAIAEKYPFTLVFRGQGVDLHAISQELDLEGAKVGDTVSLIPLSDVVEGVRTQGLEYPLRGEALFRASSRGVSNRVTSLPAGVSLEKGKLLVVHIPSEGG